MAIKKAKVITTTSVKGGTGKSTVTLCMAGILSSKKIKTIILDLDLSYGAIASSLNVPVNQDIYSLTDDIMNNRFENLDKYITKYNDYIDVLASSNDPRNALKIYPQYIETIIKQLEYKYDIILIDTNHAVSETNLITFDNSDKIIYVLTDDLIDLRNAKTMLSIYEDMELTDRYILVLNEIFNRNLTNFELKTVLDKEIDYILPKSFLDIDIQKLVLNGQILSIEKPKNKGVIVLKEMLEKILN